MKNNILLSYVCVKNSIFDYTNFNFDKDVSFEMSVNKERFSYLYCLKVTKKDGIRQPERFWGNNIIAANLLLGENGSGKTSFFKILINKLCSGITASSSEMIFYIIKYNNQYIYFSNLRDENLKINGKKNCFDILLKSGKKFYDELRSTGEQSGPYDNRKFWDSFIFYTNYFATTGIRNSNFVINIGKGKEIDNIIKNIIRDRKEKNICIEESTFPPIDVLFKQYRDQEIFDLYTEEKFQQMAKKCKISVPNLLKIEMDSDAEISKQYMDMQKFPNEKWVGEKRYKLYEYDDGKYYYEAAVNKFSVHLILYLNAKGVITQDDVNKFFETLRDTSDKTGIEIAHEQIQDKQNEELEAWVQFLKFVIEKSNNKKFILEAQLDDYFCCVWEREDYEVVKKVFEEKDTDPFFNFELVGSLDNGFYSSGEETKLSIFMALYEALKIIEIKEKRSGNLLLLIDEVDAFFHPKYQISIVSELLEVISKEFSEYNIQIIMASNTPLEVSDFPSDNIIYLSNAKENQEQNKKKTFGSNVCSLLNDQFFINTTMGEFAKRKINNVISFLKDDAYEMDEDEVKYIISIIGEPIIKKKLEEMYAKKQKEKLNEMEYYLDIIQKLQEKMENSDLDDQALEAITTKLTEVVSLVKKEEEK